MKRYIKIKIVKSDKDAQYNFSIIDKNEKNEQKYMIKILTLCIGSDIFKLH